MRSLAQAANDNKHRQCCSGNLYDTEKKMKIEQMLRTFDCHLYVRFRNIEFRNVRATNCH